MKKTAKARKVLPTFTSIEEEAEFWDTHGTEDYIDKNPTEEIAAILNEDPGVLVPFRLQPDVYAILKEKARELHLSPASLARRIVIEKLCSDGEAPRENRNT